MSKKKGLGKLFAGLAVGAGLGMLFAPKKGSDTRKDLKDKMKLFEQKQELLHQQEEEQELKELNELIKNKNK